MDAAEGGWGGDRVPELPGSGAGRPQDTASPQNGGGVLGVALTVCVHIRINYGFHKLRVRRGQTVGYQFYFFSFLQLL